MNNYETPNNVGTDFNAKQEWRKTYKKAALWGGAGLLALFIGVAALPDADEPPEPVAASEVAEVPAEAPAAQEEPVAEPVEPEAMLEEAIEDKGQLLTTEGELLVISVDVDDWTTVEDLETLVRWMLEQDLEGEDVGYIEAKTPFGDEQKRALWSVEDLREDFDTQFREGHNFSGSENWD